MTRKNAAILALNIAFTVGLTGVVEANVFTMQVELTKCHRRQLVERELY
jgi:hypothetical protein